MTDIIMINIKQVRSVIRCTKAQRDTIKGLGLRGIGSKSTLKLTDSIMGMIRKVSHLIVIDQ